MTQHVYTLLCNRDMPMACVTLPKILEFLSQEQLFVVIDDGSLTEHSIEYLKELSPQIKVISLKDREQIVLNKLDKYPECRKFRKEYAPAYKLIDIPILAMNDSPRFCYTDSDIIYLKSCEPCFNRQVNTYLKTDAIKISVKLSKVFLKYRWAIPNRFNSGYFSYDVKDYDLDLIEHFVSRPDVRNIPWVIEQTGWALLFGQSKELFCPDEDKFICRENFNGPDINTFAIHLIGNLKPKYKEWAYFKTLQTNDLDFIRSRNVTLLDWYKKSARRFFKL